MVKLVDTQVSGTCGGNSVEVRVLFSAPLPCQIVIQKFLQAIIYL